MAASSTAIATASSIGTTKRLYGHIESGRAIWVRKAPKTGNYIVLLMSQCFGIAPELCKALDMAEETMRQLEERHRG